MDAFTYELFADSVRIVSVLEMFANGEIMFHFKGIGVLQRTFGIVIFIDMNTYVLNGTNFKMFLKENYTIALLDSCYLLK